MNNKKFSKWRRYMNIILGVSSNKPKRTIGVSAGEPSSSIADAVYAPNYRYADNDDYASSMRVGPEMQTAGAAPGQPGIQYCGI